MTIGKQLLIYSVNDPEARDLAKATSTWGCMVSASTSRDQFRGHVEGSDFDLVLCDSATELRQLIAESASEEVLRMPLAEVENVATTASGGGSLPYRKCPSSHAPGRNSCGA